MMSDSLAAINVDQLSNAVSAVVNATPGHCNTNGSVSQSAMGLQMPVTTPASIQNTVMVHVDRQLLTQLAFPPASVSASEVSAIDGPLLQHSGTISGAFQTGTSQQQNRSMQSVLSTVGPPAVPQNTQLTAQMMAQPAATGRQLSSGAPNFALMNAVQMLNAPANVSAAPVAPQSAPHMLGTQMVVPSIITSVVPAATAQSMPQGSLVGSQLVLSREGGGTGRVVNAFMAKQGREQMVFNIQPELARGGNTANSNNILQLVPISNSNNCISNQQPANQNPMINMSIAIHLPTHGNQGNKDTTSDMKQARTIPLSQLMTGQPIPVSQITAPLQMALDQAQDRAPAPSGTAPMLSVTQFNNSNQGVSASQLASHLASDHGQAPAGNALPSQMSIPLSQLTLAQAIPVSQITSQLSDSAALQISGHQQAPAPSSSIQLPQSVFQSFSANPSNNSSSAYITSAPTATVTTSASVPPQAPVVIMGQEVQGKSYWNIQSLDNGSQLATDLTSQLAPSLTSQTLDVPSVPTMPNASKTQRPAEVDLGMVSISPDGLVTSMSADDMTTLDLGATESIENLAMPFEEETSNVWCIDCNHYNPAACTIHGPPTIILDAQIPCRAKLSLPSMLKLAESLTKRKRIRCGVIAIEDIQPRCQFGPLVGKVINKNNDVLDTDSNRVWKVFRNGIVSHFIDISDENQSNWMRYVRLANKRQDQNVVAHQSGGNIYFTTSKPIASGEELKAWYSQDYAQWHGVPEEPGSSFHCSQCPMQFLQRKQLVQHLGFKHPDMASRRFKCSVCPRAFISNTKLQLHMLTHMGLKPYKCGHCSKQFSDPSNLRIHTRIHTEEKKFVCDICRKPFRQKIHLISHMTTHTGEKHLKCPFCELTFATHSTLRQHKFTHDSDNESQCEKCGRRFKTHQMLQKHVKTHTWKRDYKCLSCSKAFYTPYHAKRHHQNCRGPRDEREKKRQERREEGDGKPRRRRGRPARHHRKPSEDLASSSLSETQGVNSGGGNHSHWAVTTEHFGEPRLSSRRQESCSSIDDQRQPSRGEKRGSKAETDRPVKEALSIRPAPCFFVNGGVMYPPDMEAGVSTVESPDKHGQHRQGSDRDPASEASSSSQGKRHDGRPVRRRKMPKRYAPDEDQSTERKTRDAKQGRGESPGIYIFNIMEAGGELQASAGKEHDSPTSQSLRGGRSNNTGNSPTGICDTGAARFNTSPTLGHNILDDNGDSRGSVSAALSELMGSDDLQSASWEASIGVSSLNHPARPIGGRSSEAGGSLSPMAARSSSLETATSPPSSAAAIAQPLDDSSHLEMPSALFSARSSPVATRSLTMQMRREGTSDMEANDQCDDEARAGTVNDNVEE